MPARMATVAPRAAICASARSTKITPRSTTCTPRYACMPVKIRLAINGHNRNGRISIVSFGLLESLFDQVDIVIEQLKIICHLLLSAYRREVHEYFGSCRRPNAVRRFQIKIRLDQNEFAILALHQPNQFDGVAGRRWNAGPRLHISDHFEVKMLGEVGEGIVIGHYL